MSREEIIKYLDACLEAEIGLSDSNTIIEVLRNKAKYLNETTAIMDLPNVPVREKDEPDIRSEIEYTIRKEKDEYRFAILSLSLNQAKERKQKIAQYDEELQKAIDDYPQLLKRNENREIQYQLALTRYNRKNEIYKAHQKEILEAFLDELYDEIHRQKEFSEKFSQILRTLYDMNILYSEYQNSEAVYYLRRYLIIGVTDQLEGPDGAYRLYMDDLKFNKLSLSLKEIQNAVESGFENVLMRQNSIYQQLLSTRKDISLLSEQIDHQTTQMSANMRATAERISQSVIEANDAQNVLMKELQEDQRSIRTTMEKSAYNQYMVEKQENLDNYLAYRLENPLIH